MAHYDSRLHLDKADVHVWRCWLDQPASTVAQLERLLSADERARCARFAFEQLRSDFIIARGMLRTILAAYAGADPVHLRFNHNRHGKPALQHPHDERLQFNLSHAHRLMALAVTQERLVGVDIEHIRLDLDHRQMASRFFSAREQDDLRLVSHEDLPQAFFLGWTRKEAYIKAIGAGLSHPLNQFDVTLRPDDPAALLATRPDPAEASRWRLAALTMPAGYVGAVVAAGRNWRLTEAWWPA